MRVIEGSLISRRALLACGAETRLRRNHGGTYREAKLHRKQAKRRKLAQRPVLLAPQRAHDLRDSLGLYRGLHQHRVFQ